MSICIHFRLIAFVRQVGCALEFASPSDKIIAWNDYKTWARTLLTVQQSIPAKRPILLSHDYNSMLSVLATKLPE